MESIQEVKIFERYESHPVPHDHTSWQLHDPHRNFIFKRIKDKEKELGRLVNVSQDGIIDAYVGAFLDGVKPEYMYVPFYIIEGCLHNLVCDGYLECPNQTNASYSTRWYRVKNDIDYDYVPDESYCLPDSPNDNRD
jgi:hypothetical protein